MMFRDDRRYGMPKEDPWLFEIAAKERAAEKSRHYQKIRDDLRAILVEIMNSPDRFTYRDVATTPPGETEFESLDLYHATRGGEAALARKRREDMIRSTGHANAPVSTP
jgi:hypothetical protein